MKTAPLSVLVALVAAFGAGCDSKSSPSAPSPTSGTGGPAAPAASHPADSSAAPAGETTYYFGVRETHTNITFQSKNDLTDILGASHNAVGSATINFQAGTGSCELSVPASTLNSGMADRDRAMMGPTWLSVKQHPNIEFRAQKAALTDKPHGWTIDGKFSLRGVTRDLSVKAEVRPLPAAIGQKLGFGDGPVVKVTAAFKIKLADYGIQIPATAVATVQPEISIGIDIWGSTVKPAALVVKAPDDGDGPIKRTMKPRASEEGIEGTKYLFGKKPQLATLTAESDTELERVIAKTSVVSGVLGFDASRGTGHLRLAIPVDELDTGIALRNEHLRSAAWLDSAKYKTITFESTQIAKKDERHWTVTGEFGMHGVKRPMTVDVEMREIPLALIQKAHWGETPGLGFSTRFKVKLSDFGVKIPEVAAAKVNDEWTLGVDLVALLKE